VAERMRFCKVEREREGERGGRREVLLTIQSRESEGLDDYEPFVRDDALWEDWSGKRKFGGVEGWSKEVQLRIL
jgi:hypothetical protein